MSGFFGLLWRATKSETSDCEAAQRITNIHRAVSGSDISQQRDCEFMIVLQFQAPGPVAAVTVIYFPVEYFEVRSWEAPFSRCRADGPM